MSQGSSSNQKQSSAAASSTDANAQNEREDLLRQVIETTFSGASQDLSDQEWESLRHVVRMNPKSATLDFGLVCQLVKALIETRFAALKQDDAMLQRMSLRISGTLWSHPVSNGRLRRFWELLTG